MGADGLHAAYVLHTRRYGDTSLILDLLVRDQGRVSALSKGALSRRRAGVQLEPLRPLLVSARGRGEVLTLVRAEPAGPPLMLAGRRLYCALYLNELLTRLTARQDPMPVLFDDYVQALEALAKEPQAEPVLRCFEVRLLTDLGLGLSLERDAAGHPLAASVRYTYDIETGPRVAAAAAADTVSGQTLLALGSGAIAGDDVLGEARWLMRRIIGHHLGGRPLRSRELFR